MGTPVASGLPAPGSTEQEIANDVGYVLPPVPTPTPPYTGGTKPIRLEKGQRVGMVVATACESCTLNLISEVLSAPKIDTF